MFVAPEQLVKTEVLDALSAAHRSLFTVDEAHCISTWGHGFRPEYLRLGAFASALGRPPILALTATSAPPVRVGIVARLGLASSLIVTGDFDRPEIELAVRRSTDQAANRAAVLRDVAAQTGSGSVSAGAVSR